MSDLVVRPVRTHKGVSLWKVQLDTKGLVWACFVGIQSGINDQLDKGGHSGI